MKKFVLIILMLFPVMIFTASGQVAVGYQTDGNTLSLSTNNLSRFWGEFRVNTKSYNQSEWSYSDRGITQLYCLTRIFSSKIVCLNSGLGVGVNLLSDGTDKWVSVNIPLGLQMNPFPSIPNLYLTGEYTPMIIVADDIPVIHSVSLGFRYLLKKDN
jgi:hypothetical protein